MPSTQDQVKEFSELLKQIDHYGEAVNVMEWDLRTGAPKKAVESRSEAIGLLSTEMFKLTVSEQMGGYLDALMAPGVFETLSEIDRRSLEECKKDYDRNKKIPASMHQEYVVLTNQAQSAWEGARENNDFASFKTYLERIVEMKLQYIDKWGYEGSKYDTLLDLFEPGMTTAKLDEVFGVLRERTVPLVSRVAASQNKPDTSCLRQTFDPAKQKAFGLYILKEIGYDFAAGRLDESQHPFETALNLGDVRITTRYKPDDVAFALTGTIHECGHALYEQNISPDLAGTPLRGGASYGIHESQSRFWENMVGLSRPFWSKYYPELTSRFPGQFDGVSVDEFYRAINEAKPSLIRIEADELTYNLHIMVRYEIEKALINGEAKVADLPELWSSKYQEYLGVTPPNDKDGVLQDVHWSGGDFGYFPSYALGNMYAAQFRLALLKDLPNFDELIGRGDFAPIRGWLKEHIHQYGKLLTPAQLVQRVTGEELNPVHLADYLEEKYSDLYHL